MAQFAARAINNKVRISSAQVFFQPEGSAKLFNLGDMETLVYTPNIQEWENWTRQHGTKQLAGTYPIQKGATLELSTRSWTELIHQMMYVSEGEYVEQEAAISETYTFEDVEVGDLYKIPVKNGTATSADDGAAGEPIDWTEGVGKNFTFHKPSGMIEILSVPEAADNKLVLGISAPAIADVDKLLKLDLMTSNGITGRVVAVGVNQQGAKGELDVNNVKFLPSAGAPSVGGDEGDVAALTGRVYVDENGKFGTWTAYEKI